MSMNISAGNSSEPVQNGEDRNQLFVCQILAEEKLNPSFSTFRSAIDLSMLKSGLRSFFPM